MRLAWGLCGPQAASTPREAEQSFLLLFFQKKKFFLLKGSDV